MDKKKCNSPYDHFALAFLDSLVYGLCCSVCFMHPKVLEKNIDSSLNKLYFIMRNTSSIVIIYSTSVLLNEMYKQRYLTWLFYYNKGAVDVNENNQSNSKLSTYKVMYNKLIFALFATSLPMLSVRIFYFYRNEYAFISKQQFKLATLCLFGFNLFTS